MAEFDNQIQGKSYRFKIGGIRVGGIGISKFTAKGEVYDLENPADFYGSYGSYAAARVSYVWSLNRLSGSKPRRLMGGFDCKLPCGLCQL